MDALLHKEASWIHGIYLWRIHSIVHAGSGFYRSTITASTGRTAIRIVLQIFSVIRVLARRSLDILVSYRLGSGAIRRGRLTVLCANDIHDPAFSMTFSDFYALDVANYESASAFLTTVVHESHGMLVMRANWSKTIFATAGTNSGRPRVSRGATFLVCNQAYLIQGTNVSFHTMRPSTRTQFPPSRPFQLLW